MGRTSARTLIAAATLGLLAIPAQAAAQDGSGNGARIGEGEYRSSCAPCHGPAGTGDGPVARFLNVAPADLTRLAAENDGRFPFLDVFQVIDGRALLPVHGERTMPIWGDRYRAEAGERYGPFGGETVVRGRILELVNYVASLQQPGPDTPVLEEEMAGVEDGFGLHPPPRQR